MERPIRIGRAADNDIVVDHPAVSEHHAELVPTGAGVRLRDLSSSSGTRLNGTPVTGAVLADGDVIGIGQETWVLAAGELAPWQQDAPPLEASDVSVNIGKSTILAPTSLTVGEGEMLAIIGPSGSGKSTLLNVLAGLRQPTTGRVLLGGDDVRVRQADLGYVPQEDTVHRLLTAREALTFASELRLPPGISEADTAAAVERVLRDVELLEVADQRIGTLSGGQRKRVAVALELIGEPRVVLLDEPTTGLDPGLEQRVMQLLRTLAHGRRSVVLITHATQSLHQCDRIAVMAPGGSLAYLGPPAGAPVAFGVVHIEDVYNALPAEAPADVPLPVPAGDQPDVHRLKRDRPIVPQTTTLVRRYAMVFSRDRRNLAIMLSQVAVLGIGAALLFRHNVFGRGGSGYLHAGASAQLLFLMVTIAIWFGAIAAARQIVGERGVVRRELSTGVRTEAYLLSKAVVLGVVAIAQTMLMALIVFTLRPVGNDPPGGAQQVVLVLVLCSLCGVAMGLVVSAYARSEDQATSFLPLVLLPQLLFGGAIVPTSELVQPVRALSALVAAQWGFAGAGHAIDMNQRIAGDAVFVQASRYDHAFFAHSLLVVVFVLILVIAASAIVLQARLRPSFEGTWWEQIRTRFAAWNAARIPARAEG